MSYLIILQFVAPFAVLSGILLIAIIRGKSREHKAVTQFLESIQTTEEKFTEKLRFFLKKLGLKDDEINKKLSDFTKTRRKFFRQILEGVLKGDAEQLKSLATKFTSYSELYHALEVSIAESEKEIAIQDEQDKSIDEKEEAGPDKEAALLKGLKIENKRLKAESYVAISALNALFGEYASMFGEVPKDSGKMSIKEILDAMVRFTKGDFHPENVTEDMPPELLDELEAPEKAPQPDREQNEEDLTMKADSEKEVEPTTSEEPDWNDAFNEIDDSEKPALSENEDEIESTHISDTPEKQEEAIPEKVESEAEEESWESVNTAEDTEEEMSPEIDSIEDSEEKITTGTVMTEDEPSWEDAFNEMDDEPTAEDEASTDEKKDTPETKTPSTEEPSEEEPSWEDAFNEMDDNENKPSEP